MQQHPVPQNISSYEFKLVGDMTLKQFFQLAGGLVISLIFYATPLPGFIKWPLVLLFGLVGAALAFLPIEERPLSQWAFAFFKAIYSPTLYTWSATSAEDVFAKGLAADSSPSVPNTQVGQTEEVQKFEQAEKNFFSKVTVLFAGLPHITQTTNREQSTQAPFTQGAVLSQNMEIKTPAQPTPTQSGQAHSYNSGQANRVEMAMPVPTSAPIKVQIAPIQVQYHSSDQEQAQGPLTPVYSSSRSSDSPSSQGSSGQATQATFTPEAAPPAPPERPNTIVGQVLTSEGKIVEGAILEIRDSTTKTPLRALRSNRVGHFITVTPVQDGTYEIVTEKEGFTFEIVQFKAESRLIPPIQIKAQA